MVNIETYDRGDYLRVVFELTKKPKYFVSQTKNKISVRLSGVKTSSITYNNINKFGIIDNIDLINETGGVKVVITVNDGVSLKRYLYTEPSGIVHYYRMIVDIYKKKQKFESLDSFILSSIIGESIEEKSINDLIYENVRAQNIDELLDLNNINEEKTTRNIEEQNNERINMDDFLKKISVELKSDIPKKAKSMVTKTKKIIVIDAGHGGKDPGAIGLFRTKEKNINLAFAKAIKYELDKNKNFKVYLTRDGDYFIELFERVNRARNLRADLFISIHADSNINRKARGLSIYTLMKSASDTRTATMFSLSNVSGNKRQETANVMLDISRYKTLNESTVFAETLVKVFRNKGVRMLQNPHKYGNFAVLLAPEYPAVLVEVGFVSNIMEEKMLQSGEYRKKIAISVAEAVGGYFGKYSK
jgi:N-acetylmuramoyl-L-alanine amidase